MDMLDVYVHLIPEACREEIIDFLEGRVDLHLNGPSVDRRTRAVRTDVPFRSPEMVYKCLKNMVLLDRIELSTSPLPRECSTTELQQRRRIARGRYLAAWPCQRKPVSASFSAACPGGAPSGSPACGTPRSPAAGQSG